MDFINELVDPKTVRKWTEEAAKEFEIGGTKVQLTIPQIMSLYCLMKRDQGRQHIIGTQIPTENGILDIRGGGFKAEPISHTQKGKKAKIEKAKVVDGGRHSSHSGHADGGAEKSGRGNSEISL